MQGPQGGIVKIGREECEEKTGQFRVHDSESSSFLFQVS